ncbi:hypothetical protein JOD63_000733 [Microbacterium terrae]|uniref:Large exoprotein n=1 Tax=Microbacterium terrae TaxID=69369 RepID=A0A0M2HE35_9MICO|nr:hypothetical protein [Microbacterium terrae]KJL44899.1 hypothetical protein RS81_00367 [Microbacterium terrae]MBP1076765.1 hypothetical protein [Microbacterium terrae]GLJ97596.1 hypothetical protein GCM10017594_07930 [Microbacterium terrae]
MGGQVLGGGVIVLVAVALWLVYLMPTLQSRRQYDAAERNAVRLNQALRVLAETSETPEEVRLELNTRTALAQQKLARRAMAERESAALEGARVDLERARIERAVARNAAPARQARARRRLRLTATILALAGIGIAVWGVVEVLTVGAQALMWSGVALTGLSALVLHRMARVAARAALPATESVERVAREVQDVALEPQSREWAPRELPRPLTASAGSRAAAVLDVEAARDALRQAAMEEALRSRVEEQEPTRIETARVARSAADGPDFASMGYVDDEEIEAHVRGLLARRASGQ